MVVEDEQDSVDGLIAMLHEFCPEVSVAATARTAQEAIHKAGLIRPDLIFLDVEMPGGSGFQLIESFSNGGRPEIIFTTAHEHYAIRALRENASDYLLKPIDIDELVQAVRKAAERLSGQSSVFPVLEQKLRILTPEGMHFASQRDVLFIAADGRYSRFYFLGGKTLLAAHNIGEYEDELCYKGFFRVHKSYLVNCEHIARVGGENGLELVLNENHRLEISRRRKAEFLDYLKKSNRL